MPALAIATWNLHGGEGNLGALAADLRSGRLTGGVPPAQVVFLLQEASAATRLEGLVTFFAPARTVDGVARGNAILSTLPLDGGRAIELPRERQRRVAAVATIVVGGTPLLLANVHLENRASWWKGLLPGDAARARQMAALLAALPADVPGILGGDLNIWLGTSEPAYQLAVKQFPDGLAPTPPKTFRERLALDHLLYRLPAGWSGSSARAPQRYGSDHFPVVGVLVTR